MKKGYKGYNIAELNNEATYTIKVIDLLFSKTDLKLIFILIVCAFT